MGPGLVFPGEVQVDIRHLVPVEPQEYGERDIVPVPDHGSAAFRAVLFRQVEAGPYGAIGEEFRMVAVRAPVMGHQRIHFRDVQHGGHKGGPYGPPGPHHVPVVVGFLHQQMGDVVQHREPVADNGGEFLLQPVLHDLRQLGAVPFVGSGVAQGFHLFLGPGDGGRIQLVPVGHRLEMLHLVADFVGVFHHHFIGPVPQVGKFLQHLFGGPQVQGRLFLIRIAHPGLEDLPGQGVFRIQEVDVAGGHGEFSQFVPQGQDLFVDGLEVFHRMDVREPGIPDQVVVVARGLDLQIVVVGGDLLHFLIGEPGQDGPVHFPGGTGGSDDQPVPVLVQEALGHPGPLGFAPEILEVGQGHQPVQVPEPFHVFGQQDDVVVLLVLPAVAQVSFHPVDQLQFPAVLFGQVLGFIIGKGKGLYHPVIRQGQGLVAPAHRRIHQFLDGSEAVHLAHLGVAV